MASIWRSTGLPPESRARRVEGSAAAGYPVGSVDGGASSQGRRPLDGLEQPGAVELDVGVPIGAAQLGLELIPALG
jgi:hypothetical protein